MKELTNKMLKKLADSIVGKKANRQKLIGEVEPQPKLIDDGVQLPVNTTLQQNSIVLSNEEKELAERTMYRLLLQEVNRQKNLEDILEKADAALSAEASEQQTDQEVDTDWFKRFTGYAQDITNEDLKILWAKILAKEVARPSTYSLRTLDILRNISYDEAKLFTKLCEFVFLQEEFCFVYKDEKALKKKELGYWAIARLKEAGLLQADAGVTKTFAANKTGVTTHLFVCGNKFFKMTLQPGSENIVVPIYLLSQAGRELYDMTGHKDNEGYIQDFVAFVKKANPTASVQYGKVLERKGTKTKYELPLIEL